MNWESLSGKEAKTLDNSELGKVKGVTSDYVFTEKGVIDKEKFYVPRRFADRFDGKTLWFSITKAQYDKRYTTVEKKITERTIETGPSGETKEKIVERSG